MRNLLVQIAHLHQHPEYTETAVDWIANEWGSSRETARNSLKPNQGCPPAFVAMNSAGAMGILGYTDHILHPQGTHELWINALYVAPRFRGHGLGSRLVREGVKAARSTGRDSLFVYTDIPTFYESLGWQRFSYNDQTEMHILEYNFRPESTAQHHAEDT